MSEAKEKDGMKTYKAIVSIGISDMTNKVSKVFIQTLTVLNWHKVEGLAETWELSLTDCENKDMARFTIIQGVMQAKMECGCSEVLKIVIAFDYGKPTHISLS